MALIASGIGSAVGLGTGLAAGKRPIAQRIAVAEPSRLARQVFHPSANQGDAKRDVAVENVTASAEAAHTTTESPVRGDSLQAADGAETARAIENAQTPETARTVDSTLATGERVTSGVAGKARGAQSVKPATVSGPAPTRKAKQLSAHFGQSEIVDPWGDEALR